MQFGCASHALFWEGCSVPGCAGGPHVLLAKNIIDWIWAGLIFASPGSDHGSFEVSGADWTIHHTDAPDTTDTVPDEATP